MGVKIMRDHSFVHHIFDAFLVSNIFDFWLFTVTLILSQFSLFELILIICRNYRCGTWNQIWRISWPRYYRCFCCCLPYSLRSILMWMEWQTLHHRLQIYLTKRIRTFYCDWWRISSICERACSLTSWNGKGSWYLNVSRCLLIIVSCCLWMGLCSYIL